MIQITEKLQKKYLTDYNLLIAQDFWEAHFQIFLIILLKELIKSNVNTNTMTKNVKLMELNITVNLFYCCEKVFTHMNTWMIRKNSMKRHYLQKKIFTDFFTLI